jgi:flagellar M-ring protein FliF
MMSSYEDVWKQVSSSKKAGLIVGVIVIASIALASFYWIFSVQYKPLFSHLEPQDASSIVTELELLKVPYRLQDSGSSILVPESQVHEVRLKLMGTEVKLNNGVGFELFNESDFGMTEFVQRINYQRALQGELARTISSLNEVKYARVHLSLPESSLFKQEQDTARASVTLFMKSEKILSAKQVLGIQRLVTSSVPGIDIKNVTVLDQSGNTLSRPLDDGDDTGTLSTRLERQKELEHYLAEKATQVLDKALGTGVAVVTVNATINLDKISITREDILAPEKQSSGIVRRRETTSNMVDGKDSDAKNNSTEIEYRLGHEVDQIVKTPGAIDHLSVAVVVSSTTSTKTIAKVRDLVESAIGLKLQRGDTIVVHALSGNEPSTQPTAPIPAVTAIDSQSASPAIPINEQLSQPDNIPSTQTTLTRPNNYLDRLWYALRSSTIAQVFVGIVLSLVIIVFVLLARLTKYRSSQQPRALSPEERNTLLVQLRTWLEETNKTPQNEAKLS